MGFWNNLGFNTCPSGQRYSQLLQMCVAEDTDGSVTTTAGGGVLINDEKTGRGGGDFWERAPDYIDSLANLWGAIKGQPVQYTGESGNPNYPPPKDNSGMILTVGILGMLLILTFILLAIRRKK